MNTVVLSIAMAVMALAQTPDPAKRVEFEVASIRPAKVDDGQDIDTDKGIFRAHNVTVKRLIALAYNADGGQIFGGSSWVGSDGYDINAKIPEEFAQQTHDKLPQMLQSLLADRFQLAIHRDPRQVSGYALLVAKKGPKMEAAKADQKGSDMSTHNNHLTAKNATMERFATYLSRRLGQPVIDKTGLTGGFNFELDWKPERRESEPAPLSDGVPSIFTALQERLGLRLESAKVPVLAVVIDRAEKPEGN